MLPTVASSQRGSGRGGDEAVREDLVGDTRTAGVSRSIPGARGFSARVRYIARPNVCSHWDRGGV